MPTSTLATWVSSSRSSNDSCPPSSTTTITTVAPRFFASASASAAIFFTTSRVRTFFTGNCAFAGWASSNGKVSARKRIRFILMVSRWAIALLTIGDCHFAVTLRDQWTRSEVCTAIKFFASSRCKESASPSTKQETKILYESHQQNNDSHRLDLPHRGCGNSSSNPLLQIYSGARIRLYLQQSRTRTVGSHWFRRCRADCGDLDPISADHMARRRPSARRYGRCDLQSSRDPRYRRNGRWRFALRPGAGRRGLQRSVALFATP